MKTQPRIQLRAVRARFTFHVSHFTSALAIVGLALACCPINASPPDDLDALVERTRREFDLPGISVAIVKDGQAVVVKGYGVRQAGEAAPVDAETLFNIGSNTKAFTAATLATLVEEGRLNWDDPVNQHLPGFQMYDPWVTREITVRDLLSHHSGLGLGAGDLLFYPETNFSREEIVARLRFLKPATSFRSRFAYDNGLFIVAGQLAQAITGKTWEAAVQERLLAPLGMQRTSFGPEAIARVENKAIPHVQLGQELKPAAYGNFANFAPAGGINSCAQDMARWVTSLLADAKIRTTAAGGKPLLSPASRRELWSAQTVIAAEDETFGPVLGQRHFAAYGLGFTLSDYRGHKLVWHGGGLPGQFSWVMLVPDLGLGIVLLSNTESYHGTLALTYHLLDRYLGIPATDWITAVHKTAEQERAQAAKTEARLATQRNLKTKPSLPLPGYAGRYLDPWYGAVTLASASGGLVLRFSRTPRLVADLEHWQHDTFVARWRDRTLNADAFVYFALNPDGTIAGMKLKPVSPLTDFSFDFHDLDFKLGFPRKNGHRIYVIHYLVCLIFEVKRALII